MDFPCQPFCGRRQTCRCETHGVSENASRHHHHWSRRNRASHAHCLCFRSVTMTPLCDLNHRRYRAIQGDFSIVSDSFLVVLQASCDFATLLNITRLGWLGKRRKGRISDPYLCGYVCMFLPRHYDEHGLPILSNHVNS